MSMISLAELSMNGKVFFIIQGKLLKSSSNVYLRLIRFEWLQINLFYNFINNVKPETTAGFFNIFYREISLSKISIFEIYDIKKKKFKLERTEEDIYSLTDSEEDEK